MLNHNNESIASKCPECNSPYITKEEGVYINEFKCRNCGIYLYKDNIQIFVNNTRSILLLKKPPGFKSQNKQTIFKNFLKLEAKIILNNINNYSMCDQYQESSICRYCNRRIDPSFLPLILWNKDQIHFLELHVECVIKKEKLQEFIEFIDDFDYIYEIED